MPDIQVTVISPDRVLSVGEDPKGNPLPDHPVKLLAQGDSWFSIGALPPWSTTNLVQQLTLSVDAVLVNCAYPGRELARMTDTVKDQKFLRLLTTNFGYKWDAILISGGGNDLVDALGGPPADAPLAKRLLLTAAEWGPEGDGPARYFNEAGWATFEKHMGDVFDVLLKARNVGQNAQTPIVFHNYDFPTPRPAPAPLLGPWLFPVLGKKYAIPQPDWVALTDYLMTRLSKTLGTIITDRPGSGLTLVDTQGTLTRAALGATGVSGDWQNEIHPRGVGYAKLAAVWRPVLEKVLSA